MDREKLTKEIKGWTLTILAVLAFRTFLYEAVYIPSGSMIPTLQIGDYVVVEKWAYGARLPFTGSTQAQWSTPARGDIVVLLAPPGNSRSDDLIKRVVAVGGDTIAIRNGALVLDGVPVERQKQPGPCTYWNRPDGGSWREHPCDAFAEVLGAHRFTSTCAPGVHCGEDMPEFKVPDGHVFLVGDHRDQSADSRYFGPVPVGRIKGRAWVALVSWGPNGPRWDRLFHGVKH